MITTLGGGFSFLAESKGMPGRQIRRKRRQWNDFIGMTVESLKV
jgi:hypothetical protein